ncbi:MAG: hypothetical protein Q7J25_08810 [Vicinamibacterales bacterium]|nr:hypothetical protein [Vicinamibacterales bacterium]
MPLRIACDLDGTVADMDGALQHHAEALFGPGVDVRFNVGAQREPPSDGEAAEAKATEPSAETATDPAKAPEGKRRALTTREYSYLWSHVRKIENFWETLTEIEAGGVARFSELAQTRGWEVLFVTQRPPSAGDLAQRQSVRWLIANGYDMPSAFVMNGNRGALAHTLRLDAFIDDRGENCIDIATESRALPLLLWRGSRELAPPGASRMKIHTVFSFAEALDCLEALSEARSRPPSMMSRIKQALRP